MGFQCEVVVADRPAGTRRRVRVAGEDGDLFADLLTRLDPFWATKGQVYLDGRIVDPTLPVVESGMVDGSTFSVAEPITWARLLHVSTPHLRVVGGVQAGRVFDLPRGRTVIGRGTDAGIVLDDPHTSRVHAELVVGDDGTMSVGDLGSANGVFVEGRRITSVTMLEPGDRFEVGMTLLEVVHDEPETLPTTRCGTTFEVLRRFRRGGPTWADEVEFPPEPTPVQPPGIVANLVLSLAPAAVLVAIALLAHQKSMLLFAAVSPVLGIGRAIVQHRTYRRSVNDDAARYERNNTAAQEKLHRAVRDETVARLESSPDLASLVLTARLPGRGLWERRPGDRDFLTLRVGTARRPTAVRVTGSTDTRVPDLWRSPVTVDLRTVSHLSVVGPHAVTRSVAASLVLQLAVRNAPSELKLMTMSDGAGESAWGWATWLPHARWTADEPFCLVGSDGATTASRLQELKDLIRQRHSRLAPGQTPTFLPYVVVVLDDTTRALADGVREILTDGPAVGVHAICLDESNVPEQCDASLVVTETPEDGRLEQRGQQTIARILLDLPAPDTCDVAGRALAALRTSGAQDGGARELPATLRLLDLLDLPKPTADDVVERWQRGSGTPAACIGLSPDGPLELSFTKHGPHGLVAGTTRSGKSEFLKTLVASLALANHPDDLHFLFVDFKGGADYQLAKQLPHAVALATNESVEQLEELQRATRLLEAEIGRRRDAFTAVQTTTIEAYATARQARAELPPIGRLVVIVDEFAELASRAPDQLERLVSVARTGAAFGVHLLLATQRPAGAVTGQIDANVALRVCFRVRGREESIEVIGAPDAGEVQGRHRGRGFVRAHSGPLIELQAARVGGARPGSQAERVPLRAELRVWNELGLVPPADLVAAEVPDPETDFWDVVKAVVDAAAQTGWTESCVPWPKSLPACVTLDELPATADSCVIPVALVDDPETQTRDVEGVHLGTGHVAFGGSPRTGRTTALRTLACRAALQLRASELSMYLLDFSGGGLHPVADLPHCGGTAFDDLEQTSRILRALDAEVTRRLDHFSRHGYASLADQHAAEPEPMPYVLLCVDGWDALVEDGARLGIPDEIGALLSKGLAVGVHAVIAGDRTVASGRVGRQIATRFALRFNDPNDYMHFGFGARDIPSVMPDGRALVAPAKRLAQVATVGDDPSSTVAVRELVARVRERDADVRDRWPQRVEPLPRSLSLTALLERDSTPAMLGVPIVLGLGGRSGAAVCFDAGPARHAAFVGGPPGSGRTTALRTIGQLLVRHGVPTAVVDPRSSGLASLDGTCGIIEGSATRELDLDAVRASGARVVLIDDADVLDPRHDAHVELATGAAGLVVVAAFASDTLTSMGGGWVDALKRTHTGLLIWPRSRFDGVVFGVNSLEDTMLVKDPAGRAVAGVGGRIELVQVAAPDE